MKRAAPWSCQYARHCEYCVTNRQYTFQSSIFSLVFMLSTEYQKTFSSTLLI